MHFSSELGSSKSLKNMEMKLCWNNIGEREASDLKESISQLKCLKALILRLDMFKFNYNRFKILF